jgi:nitroreductase
MDSHPKVARADHDIHELIRHRWSPRAFDPDRVVPRDELLRLFEAARWAPSAGNEQPWRFLVFDRARHPDGHRRLLATLTPTNQAWAAASPVLALAVVRATREANEAPNAHAWYDTGQAVGLLTVQATYQGLSIRQMEGFDRDRAADVSGVPPPFVPAVAMAIGYAGDPATLALDKHRAAEAAPRARKPLGAFVFEGRWGG